MSEGEQDIPIQGNLIEIRTMTDEECVNNWAAQNKISAEAIERLFKEGFTSMEALKLVDSDDLSRTKISRGQQKLILASVARLLKSESADFITHSQGDNDIRAEEPPANQQAQQGLCTSLRRRLIKTNRTRPETGRLTTTTTMAAPKVEIFLQKQQT
ncbi:MAG: hypothetical protein AB2693_34135 [Candidatus Thiodiazotropha sp.]